MEWIKPTLLCQLLSPRNLAHKVRLLLLHINWEAILLRLHNSRLQRIALSILVCLSLLLCGARQALRLALQMLSELWVGAALVIEVNGVSYDYKLAWFR